MKAKKNGTGLTLGMKILIGVAVTSNICIGSLVYAYWAANKKVENNVNELLAIRQQDSARLRETIVSLQNRMLGFGEYLKVDPAEEIRGWLGQHYTAVSRATLTGRDAYAPLFNRTERRDLTRRHAVVKPETDGFSVSFGIFDPDGAFTDTVERTIFALPDGEEVGAVREAIASAAAELAEGPALERKLAGLGAVIADEALNAERIRTEILGFTEIIDGKEKELAATRQQNVRFIIIFSVLAVGVNLAVISLLTRVIVEGPLTTLITKIDELRAGRTPEIPWRHRKDQIGVLSGAISNFRDALIDIRREGERKREEKGAIDATLELLSATINELEGKARELTAMATDMEGLAGATSTRSAFVAQRAQNTAAHTVRVAESADRLHGSVRGIHAEMARQNTIVGAIGSHTEASRTIIDDLVRATADINGIVGIVREISDQTKLLGLNATIEAARAGKYGLGFGVVAREVKDLSLQTGKATVDIDERIKAIERVCEGMITAIRHIDENTASLREVSTSIGASLEKQQHDTDTISQLALKTSEDTGEVSDHIRQVREAASDTMQISARVSRQAGVISERLTGLLEESAGRLQQIGRYDKAA